ncbi:hypothetical protein QT397_24735 [Microbulbifer sp. MKSA007]|nr:hypothetical protein QT397_24735 [Microbulbifer sp. MKSA007]
MKILLTILVPFFAAVSWAGSAKVPNGVWQPSYAFLGKMPWNKNYLIVNDGQIIVESLGLPSEKYEYEALSDDADIVIKLSNSKLWKFKLNPKYGCVKKNKYSYDSNCTQQDQRKVFTLLECESTGECKILDSYFSFEDKELVKLRLESENL